MKKRLFWMIAAMLLAGASNHLQAQIVTTTPEVTDSLDIDVDDYDDEDEDLDDDDDVVPTEDEISVTDKEGNEEIIDFPEAMTYDLDSLLNLYMSKNYLSPGDCEMKNENPTYPKEAYIERLSRMPTVMEMA